MCSVKELTLFYKQLPRICILCGYLQKMCVVLLLQESLSPLPLCSLLGGLVSALLSPRHCWRKTCSV